MKYIKPFYLITERSLEEAVEELKDFQEDLDITSSISKLLTSIDAINIDLQTIFPDLVGDEDIKDLLNNTSFIKELKKRELRISDLNDTEESATLIKVPLRFYWIYTQDSTDLDLPMYLLMQWVNRDRTLSNIKIYYVQKEIENFYNEISSIKMTIKQKDNPENQWIYLTSNSGQNWVLQIKKSNAPTTTFKKTLNLNEVEMLFHHPEVSISFS